MTADRQAEIKRLLALNGEVRHKLSAEERRLDAERDALAREYVVDHLLSSTTWSVGSDGECLVADQALGIEVLKMFGAGFYHESFDLTGPPLDRHVHDAAHLLDWLLDVKHLPLSDVKELHVEFQLSRHYFQDVPLDEHYSVVARVDDSRLALQCSNTETLLAFVEEHKLVVRWDDAKKAIEEADNAVTEATERAERIRARMSRFLRPKVQVGGDES